MGLGDVYKRQAVERVGGGAQQRYWYWPEGLDETLLKVMADAASSPLVAGTQVSWLVRSCRCCTPCMLLSVTCSALIRSALCFLCADGTQRVGRSGVPPCQVLIATQIGLVMSCALKDIKGFGYITTQPEHRSDFSLHGKRLIV